MGYTHYWGRKPKFPKNRFGKVVQDFNKLLPIFKQLGIKLAGPQGSGDIIISDEEICFNGLEKCGHDERNLGIAWPADDASGVCFAYQKGPRNGPVQTKILQAIEGAGWSVGEQTPLALGDSDVSEEWFAGCKLRTRTCGGDCSHESLYIPRQLDREDLDFLKMVHGDKEKYLFQFCKTAYKPYDLAVICALIIARHHLGKEYIMVRSDGRRDQWSDGRQLCQMVLGYGEDFHFERGPEPNPRWVSMKKDNEPSHSPYGFDDKTWIIKDYPGMLTGSIGLVREYTHWGHRGYPLYEARPNHEHPKKFRRLDDAKAHVENELRKMRELKQMAYSQYNKDL